MKETRHFIFFDSGFRPFFLLATGFSIVAVVLWMMIWSGLWTLNSPFKPTDWHIHEMLFGFSSAVIAGFLLTAIPNWTGRAQIRDRFLAFLVALWIAGRIAVLGAIPLPISWVLVIDNSFLAVLCLVAAHQLLVSHNWRNLTVVALVCLFLCANVAFHQEAMISGAADYSRRAGMAVLILLIMLIGGRIIPSFTRNWLVKQGVTCLPTQFNRYDALSLGIAVLSLVMWVSKAPPTITAIALSVAAIIHVIRLQRWQGGRAWRSAILLMLHLSYLCIPVGFAFLALALIWNGMSAAAGLHVLGMGAIGGMTTAVMLRASMGHTARPLAAGATLSLAFAVILLAAILRAMLPGMWIFGLSGIQISAILWVGGFGIICIRIWPWLVMPRVD
ncbi:NnrS protein [Roseovarius albus]|uniref:NnrS protein n=1 Tax=Roseovarius albus TaxID=1247867 RepID=A0A1X6ZZ75_9RHOB|nr:NnrS family protein [Roseovarius albus]SLN65340.1 NnrS protein [Roseovarius albus]